MTETKPFYQSKTLIFNVLAIACVIATQFGFGDFKLDAEWTAGVIAIVNFALRLVTTKQVSGA